MVLQQTRWLGQSLRLVGADFVSLASPEAGKALSRRRTSSPHRPACAGLRRGPDFSPYHLPLHKGGFWPGTCSDVVLSGEILPISSLKSDNRNTAVPRPPCVKGAQTVEKPHVNARRTDDLASSKSPRQSFSIRRWKNKLKGRFTIQVQHIT